MATLVAIIKDCEGKLITEKAQKIPCSSNRLAKAMALKEGIILASNYLFDSILMNRTVWR